ncbi:peptidoglycan editing factor PgeF [Bryocella elongata]|uniref:peptidoglycan editing factor PgeF n=1 Tax=Bryocella elongata TaxID=863522 RepID=UPI001F2F92B9|nr:peptidoglycan editing factor PgeF [Bryocella elongata]
MLRVPAFDAIPWLHAGFSTRENGLSTVYAEGPDAPGELNLGWTSEDPEANVAANRERLTGWVAGGAHMQLVTMRQFHSGMVRVIEPGQAPLVTPNGRAVVRADALMTNVPGMLLGVQTADCVPVMIVDPKRRAVAVFHAGWRGTLARIVERGIGTMTLRYGSKPRDLVAAIGPAIGACCFAVGEEVRQQFESQFSYGAELFYEVSDADPIRLKYPMLFLTARAPGHSGVGPELHMDLFEANRRQLLDAGLKKRNITVTGECSGCTRLASGARKYFSHRMEKGFTGRMMSVIGVQTVDSRR